MSEKAMSASPVVTVQNLEKPLIFGRRENLTKPYFSERDPRAVSLANG